MSNAATNAQKIATVFGVGATLTALVSKGKVTYGNASNRLELAVPEGETKQEGIYQVTVKSDTEIEEVFSQTTEAPKAAVKPEAKVRQSPAFGYNQSAPR